MITYFNDYLRCETDSSLTGASNMRKCDIICAKGLLMTSGWQSIPAAVEEHDFAVKIGLPVLYESIHNCHSV